MKSEILPKTTGRFGWVSKLGFGRITIGVTILGLWLISSCTFDKGEVFPPVIGPCDTLAICCDSAIVTYSANVDTIIQANCLLGCHMGAFPASGPDLDSYELVKEEAINGKLLCAINWDGLCITMPLAAVQIDSVDRITIEQWINEGACP